MLTSLQVDQHLAELPESIVRRYARRLANRAPAVAARIAEPTRTEGINLRGVFTFPIEQYQAQLLPALSAAKSRAFGG